MRSSDFISIDLDRILDDMEFRANYDYHPCRYFDEIFRFRTMQEKTAAEEELRSFMKAWADKWIEANGHADGYDYVDRD